MGASVVHLQRAGSSLILGKEWPLTGKQVPISYLAFLFLVTTKYVSGIERFLSAWCSGDGFVPKPFDPRFETHVLTKSKQDLTVVQHQPENFPAIDKGGISSVRCR